MQGVSGIIKAGQTSATNTYLTLTKSTLVEVNMANPTLSNTTNVVQVPFPKHPSFQDLTGRHFGRLTPFSFIGKKRWLCLCDCGNKKAVDSKLLKRGKVTSCGCYFREVARQHAIDLRKRRPDFYLDAVGERDSREYWAYTAAKSRCRCRTNIKYPDYGGRGIEFRFTSFQEFLDEIGRRPTPTHSLDRINNDGHYEKGNIRWATRSQQARNRRKPTLNNKR